ncbi:MAG: transposase [Eubacteriales bacterium]|nr:transposase [Eubacteriales bacterium]
MKRSRYTEEQIAFALKQADLGTPISDVCRKLGVSEQTFYRWRNKFSGMLPSDMKRLKQLEEENTKLKKLVADLSLDKAIAIRNVDGVKIGYVPQADNVIFARLMDAGKLLFGKITANEMRGSWLRIDIKVFLHE